MVLSTNLFANIGILGPLQKIVRHEKSQLYKLYNVAKKNVKQYNEVKDIKSIKMAPLFLQSIILNSDPKFLEISNKDSCRFYSLLENSLLRTSLGFIDNVIISYLTKKKSDPLKDKLKNNLSEEIVQLGLLSVKDFIKINYNKKCYNQKDVVELFTVKNVKKTIKNIKFIVPKTEKDCDSILSDWSDNLYLPYLCNLSNIIRRGETAKKEKAELATGEIRKIRKFNNQISFSNKYKDLLSYFQISYIENICSNINSPKRFCNRYLAKDVWTKVLNGAKPKYLLKYQCYNILRKKNLSKLDYQNCVKIISHNDPRCKREGANNYPAIFPKQACSEISDALLEARLVTKYQDCPGFLNNEGIINTFRLIMHQEESIPSLDSKRCMDPAIEKFYNLYNESFKNWPFKICYKNRFQQNTQCTSYFPGNSKHPSSEGSVIGKIIENFHAGEKNTFCHFIKEKNYNPKRLKYQSGCFLVYQEKNCSSFNCPKKIIQDLKELKDIKYTGEILFDMIPNSFKNEFKSIAYILAKKYKSPLKSLKNLTEINFFMKASIKNIVYGVGCVEEILPRIYSNKSLNGCTPMPFIIDSTKNVKGNTKFTLRLSIDDIHSPRLVNWNHVFNGVRSFQEKHPLNLWALYGFSK